MKKGRQVEVFMGFVIVRSPILWPFYCYRVFNSNGIYVDTRDTLKQARQLALDYFNALTNEF